MFIINSRDSFFLFAIAFRPDGTRDLALIPVGIEDIGFPPYCTAKLFVPPSCVAWRVHAALLFYVDSLPHLNVNSKICDIRMNPNDEIKISFFLHEWSFYRDTTSTMTPSKSGKSVAFIYIFFTPYQWYAYTVFGLVLKIWYKMFFK